MNYQIELEKVIHKNTEEGMISSLLLHSCCAPCSSYVIEYLSSYFYITVFYFNPNIFPEEEYRKRAKEQKYLIDSMKTKYAVQFIEGRYDPSAFFDAVKGYEACKEGGQRCQICFRLRLEAAVREAVKGEFDYFTTTLTISPLKNAEILNQIGIELAEEYKSVNYLLSDFKKKGGYQRSIQLSKEYGLYRQNYCGCVYTQS